MRQIPSPQEYYVETALYDRIDFDEAKAPDVFDTLYTDKAIDMHCLECGEHSIFKAVYNIPSNPLQGNLTKSQFTFRLKSQKFLVEKKYECSRDASHKALYFTLVEGFSMVKIGQSPSLADISTNDIKKFRKVLGETYYNEFSKAVGLYAHGIGVGSFVYLRRIIENFVIKPAYETAKKKQGWDDDLFAKSRIKERIELLKSELPEFLVSNTTIYSIISKGIHELSEAECKEYFPVIRNCIEFILTEIEAERQRKLKKEELAKSLSSISQKIK